MNPVLYPGLKEGRDGDAIFGHIHDYSTFTGRHSMRRGIFVIQQSQCGSITANENAES
jgi:hypothetical protein